MTYSYKYTGLNERAYFIRVIRDYMRGSLCGSTGGEDWWTLDKNSQKKFMKKNVHKLHLPLIIRFC